MGMVEDDGWKLEVLGSDNGRVVRLVLDMGRGERKRVA